MNAAGGLQGTSSVVFQPPTAMPEAPEVEAVARTLRPIVRGKKIIRVKVRHGIAVRPQSPAAFARNLTGARIAGVERRGKYLLLPLDRGCLVMHFKFDGQLLWFDSSNAARRGSAHLDVSFETEEGVLAFVDPRHLGRAQWFPRPEDSPGLNGLGVDVFSPDFTPARLSEICRRSRRPVKILLLDQSRMAGLGNIYSSESLWRARISPHRPGDRLSAREIHRLHKAVVSVLGRALECCLHPAPDFRDSQWWFAGLERIVRVYGREGLACSRCGAVIRRMEQGGRSSFFCPRCQQ